MTGLIELCHILLSVLLGGNMSAWVRSLRISKWGLASLVGRIIVGTWLLPVIVRTSYGRGWAMAGNGHWHSGLSTRAIAAAVTQIYLTARSR
ncbi:hypothetical protein AVEN_222828-1 [Araneus ventricosus]|uniref:Uncharacterized protein n=1 Tax=Araneus ventricosus TaxID=182803 RepID=A0A4Y2GX43_ARAVE|nr:hypothetical protein AVEN_222828-1 [Araneus ventricosus]